MTQSSESPYELNYLLTVRDSTEVLAPRFWVMQPVPVVASCHNGHPPHIDKRRKGFWELVEGRKQETAMQGLDE